MNLPPDEFDAKDEQLARLLAELTDAAQRGEPVDFAAVCQQHPECADELRQLWGAAQLADVAAAETPQEDDHLPAPGDVQAHLQLPFKHGDYELIEELGRGGMGVVYRARQLSLNREVAVKMILDPAASHAALRRFQAEAEAAARLHHPNIVPVYEVGAMEGRPFFSMKLIEGETLTAHLERLQRDHAEGAEPTGMDQREAAEIIGKVARAIEVAHQHGVLHRDLKPSNILIDHDGEPHVMDFGLAKRHTPDAATLTRTGAVLGTPAYIAPEQAAGGRRVGPGVDVYSLGTILYHMITGRPPFAADTPVQMVVMVQEQDPLPPRRVAPTVDRDLEMITLRCLQKPPDLRYASANDLAEDLEAYLKDEAISARSGRLAQVIGRIFRETHHAPVLENWGLLWMWHSLVLFIVCACTEALMWAGNENRLHYIGLWVVALWGWAAIFWTLRQKMGPVLFVERQIAHIWAASMVAIAGLFPLEWALGFKPLTLSPVLALITSMVFIIKAGMFSGVFYFHAAALLLASAAMVVWKDYAHLIFGVVSAGAFFLPGLKYYRRRS